MKKTVKGFDTRRVKQLLNEAERARLLVGWMDTDTYRESGELISYIASIMENGSTKMSIPPRPMLQPAAEQHKEEWDALMLQGMEKVMSGAMTMEDLLETIGLQATSHVRDVIESTHSPELSELTIKMRAYKRLNRNVPVTGKTVGAIARGDIAVDVSGVSTKPLNDTGQLQDALTFVVETNK